jgi:hypothetical protein
MNGKIFRWLGLVVALIATGALLPTVHAQSVITLDPSLFAPGTDISNAFPGVTVEAVSWTQTGNSAATFVYTANYAPVYAGTGINGFANSTSSGPGWGPLSFGIPFTTSCIPGCTDVDNTFGTDLIVSFNQPVNFASVLQTGNYENGVVLQALNASNQVVGYCDAAAGNMVPDGNHGCYTVINVGGAPTGVDNFTLTTSVSTGSDDISKILIGAYNESGDQVTEIQYGAPEIDPDSAASGFTLLLGGLVVLRARGGARRPIAA